MLTSKLKYGIATTVADQSISAVIQRVKDVLKTEGFGVLSEIDVAKTLKEKIGADMPATVILGACNPTFAHQALGLEPNLALLLPCNVVVSDAGAGRYTVSAIDASAMLSVVGNPALDAIATQVNERFARDDVVAGRVRCERGRSSTLPAACGPQPSAETNASATVGKMISMRSGGVTFPAHLPPEDRFAFDETEQHIHERIVQTPEEAVVDRIETRGRRDQLAHDALDAALEFAVAEDGAAPIGREVAG